MRLNNLEQALKKRFPGEEAVPLARILSTTLRNGEISYEEIEDLGGSDDSLIWICHERLLVPLRTSAYHPRSSLWDDKIPRPEPGEKYEMPEAIQCLVRRAGETGEWEPIYAIERCLKDKREPKAEEALELFQRIVDSATFSKTGRITPGLLRESLSKLGLDSQDMHRIMTNFRTGGILSPCHWRPKYGVRFEINPSLCR